MNLLDAVQEKIFDSGVMESTLSRNSCRLHSSVAFSWLSRCVKPVPERAVILWIVEEVEQR